MWAQHMGDTEDAVWSWKEFSVIRPGYLLSSLPVLQPELHSDFLLVWSQMLHFCLQVPHTVRLGKHKNLLGIQNLTKASSRENRWRNNAVRSRAGGSMSSSCLPPGQSCCPSPHSIPLLFSVYSGCVNTLALATLAVLVLGASLNTKIHRAQMHHRKWIWL